MYCWFCLNKDSSYIPLGTFNDFNVVSVSKQQLLIWSSWLDTSTYLDFPTLSPFGNNVKFQNQFTFVQIGHLWDFKRPIKLLYTAQKWLWVILSHPRRSVSLVSFSSKHNSPTNWHPEILMRIVQTRWSKKIPLSVIFG